VVEGSTPRLVVEAPKAESRPFITTEGDEVEGVVAAVDASEVNSSDDADEDKDEGGLEAAGRGADDKGSGFP